MSIPEGYDINDAANPKVARMIKRSFKYGMTTLWILLQFWLQKLGLAKFRIFAKRAATEGHEAITPG